MKTVLFRRVVFLSAMILAGAIVHSIAQASDFPNRSIRLIVPYGAGPGDSLARIVASCLTQTTRQAVVVMNRPGANAVLGAKMVSTSAPDGYTILLAASATVTDLVTSQNPAFDVRTELEPITKLASGVQGVYVHSELPIRSMQELVDYARARPGELNYATAGIGSVNHVSTEAFATTAGFKMVHVPFPGGTGPFLTALMAGQIQLALTDLGGAQAALDSGRIRLLGILAKQRLQSRPNVPAVVESFPDMAAYTGTLWFGFFAPPKLSADLVGALHKEITGCLNDPQTRAQIRSFGYEESQIVANTPAQFKASILEDIERLRDIVQRAGIALR